MWRGPLSSAALATTTHRRLKGVFDGMNTQVEAQMINKCRIKMAKGGLYNGRDLHEIGGKKEREKNTIAI